MNDIVTILRDIGNEDGIDADIAEACRDGASEIERLRSRPCPYVTGTVTQHCTLTPFTLTDAEREAVERACRGIASTMPYESRRGAEDYKTLRGLLERMK